MQVADIREKRHQLQVGIQASAGRGMGLAPMGMNHELNVDAVAPHDLETCGLADNETFRRLVAQQPAFRHHVARPRNRYARSPSDRVAFA
jgi:hypothetical protein